MPTPNAAGEMGASAAALREYQPCIRRQFPWIGEGDGWTGLMTLRQGRGRATDAGRSWTNPAVFRTRSDETRLRETCAFAGTAKRPSGNDAAGENADDGSAFLLRAGAGRRRGT